MKKKILIVNANYYKDISNALLSSAQKSLPKLTQIKIINVPGVFEIPVTIAKNLKKFGLVSVSRTGAVAMTRGDKVFN